MMKTTNNRVILLKISTLVLLAFGMMSLSSCAALDRWLFRASDYSIFPSKNEDENLIQEWDLYWDDWDYDIWYDENEYE